MRNNGAKCAATKIFLYSEIDPAILLRFWRSEDDGVYMITTPTLEIFFLVYTSIPVLVVVSH